MASTGYTGRDDALAFIIEERSPAIIQQAADQSVVMQTFSKRQVGTNQLRLSLADTFPTAQWLVAGAGEDVDIKTKPVTEMSWKTQDLYIEEIATICLIPENVLDDATVNLWSEIQTWAASAVARTIDQTVLFGTAPTGSVPGSFPAGGIVGQAIAKGHVYQWGTNSATEDMAEAWNQTMSLVEADGYDVSEAYADRGIRPYFRGMRDGNGVPLYASNLQGGTTVDSVYGVPVHYVTSGVWDKTKALAVMGDVDNAFLAIRQNLTAKRLDQATVNGINLAEQDMLGLRLKARLGYAVVAPKSPAGQSANPYPFAVLAPKAP